MTMLKDFQRAARKARDKALARLERSIDRSIADAEKQLNKRLKVGGNFE